ncbi:MAG: CopD family protein [Betaproteobacteria bacterium]|nr:CopD family protein [Betaproteobacteria bacterium]
MLWVKSLHIIFVTSWFAGLFYLPRLFVNHAMVLDAHDIDLATSERLQLMERKLYRFMLPLAVLALGSGLWLWLGFGFSGAWMHAKLTLVLILIGYHLYCGKLLKDFSNKQNKHGHVWFRWFNELPVLILTAVVILVVVKPF